MFRNVYDDGEYAAAYATLDWSKTYHLVRRDLPGILERHVSGRTALDFGCGTGRSTRLLRSLGCDVIGVDISAPMLDSARRQDPGGIYVRLGGGGLDALPEGRFDVILAAFPFDNIPAASKPGILCALRRLLSASGRFVNVVSSPEMYTHEWASFSSRDFPENRLARDGDLVRTVTTEFAHAKPADDVFCSDAGYRELYRQAGLEIEADYRPLARGDEDWTWASETEVAPWVIYVAKAADPIAG